MAFEQQQYKTALERYETALSLQHPNPAFLHFRIGVIYERKTELAQAIKYLEQAVQLKPTAIHFQNKLAQVRKSRVSG